MMRFHLQILIFDNGLLIIIHLHFLFFFRLQKEKWMNVRVGDIIKLENNQFVAVRKSTHTHTHTGTHAPHNSFYNDK